MWAATGGLNEILDSVIGKVENVNTKIEEISQATEGQIASTTEISENMKEITSATQNLHGELNLVNDNINNTNVEIGRLLGVVSRFIL